jgi:hypothetical protein
MALARRVNSVPGLAICEEQERRRKREPTSVAWVGETTCSSGQATSCKAPQSCPSPMFKCARRRWLLLCQPKTAHPAFPRPKTLGTPACRRHNCTNHVGHYRARFPCASAPNRHRGRCCDPGRHHLRESRALAGRTGMGSNAARHRLRSPRPQTQHL